MDALLKLALDPRVTVRRAGSQARLGCVLDAAGTAGHRQSRARAVEAANELGKPVVVFFAPRRFAPANLRHCAFLTQGISDIAEALEKPRVGFGLRRFPDPSRIHFCEQVRAALVGGDENPIREAEG
jgi:hypothetical protein